VKVPSKPAGVGGGGILAQETHTLGAFLQRAPLHTEVAMRPLVMLVALCALLFLCACQAGPGPSSALDLQPGVGGGARVFAGPEDGVGAAARVDLGRYGFRTGKAAEPAPVATPAAPAPGAQDAPCGGGTCRLGEVPLAPAVPLVAPTLGDGGRP
jgi:hypothetical protein